MMRSRLNHVEHDLPLRGGCWMPSQAGMYIDFGEIAKNWATLRAPLGAFVELWVDRNIHTTI